MNGRLLRWTAWLLALALAASVVAAVRLRSVRTARATPPPSVASAVPVVAPEAVKGDVTVWSWNVAAKSLQALVPGFEKQTPGVRVNVDMTGARMQTRLMLSLASNVGAPDVSQFELVDAPRYIATGKLADLTPVAAKYRSSFPAYLWDNCTMNGHVYAIPWDMGPCAVYYKRDLFAKYGVDPAKIATWDDYIAAGRTILKKSGGRTRMLPLGANGLNWMFQILLQQGGGQIFDSQGRIAINCPQAREALAVIRKLKVSGICSDIPFFSQEFLAGINDESIATYPIAVWFAGTMKDTAADYAGRKRSWDVFPLPAVKPGGKRVANLGGSVLVIPAQSRNKAAAWAFIEYALCTREAQIAQYRNFSLFPAYLPALRPPGVDDPDPFFDGRRIGPKFAQGVTTINRLNITPAWGEATRYLDQALSHWAATGMHSEGFFEELEVKMERRIGKPIAPTSLSRRSKA
jgi:lactose/L-arabinose transport system substrate-binding protein